MKDNKYNKNPMNEKMHEKSNPHKNAQSDSMGHKGSESKSEKSESMDEGKRPQTKRGGRHCPNC